VPLFIEEITKTVLEPGDLRETASAYELTGPLSRLRIPSTLYDSLMARLDRLQPVKEVAQTAACIVGISITGCSRRSRRSAMPPCRTRLNV
jgi:predicted ATPase